MKRKFILRWALALILARKRGVKMKRTQKRLFFHVFLLVLSILEVNLNSVTSAQTTDIYTITASAGLNGSISPADVVSVPYGSDQSFTITPDPDYHVVDVQVDGASVGAVTSYAFTGVTSDHTINATFTINTYSLIIAKNGTGNGTVSSPDLKIDCGTICSNIYDWNTPVTLTASSDSHSTFAGWSGDCSGTATTCVVMMDKARTVATSFMLLTPPPPSSLTATPASSWKINLAWPDDTDEETGFVIERKTTEVGVYYQIASVPADSNNYSDTGLMPEVTYYYRVRSVNFEVNSAYSDEAIATTWSLLPAAPTLLNVMAISSSSIALNWQDNSDNETGFNIERKLGTCLSDNVWRQVSTTPVDITTSTVTNLLSYTTYSFRVKAYNVRGKSAYSECATAKTGALGTPKSPMNLFAIAVTPRTIKLGWLDSSTNETGFAVYRKAADGPWTLLTMTPPNTKEYFDNDTLGNSTTTNYMYYLQACNGTGCSPSTSPANVPFSPTNLKASSTISTQINLTWTDTNSNDYYGTRIFRKEGDCSSGNPWVLIVDTQSHSISYADSGLTEGTTYSYKIRSFRRSSSMPWSKGISLLSNCSSVSTIIPELTAIDVKPAWPKVLVGKSQQFKATGKYSDGTTKDLTASVTWQSSDNATLTLNSTLPNGLAAAVAAGPAIVTATYENVTGSAETVVIDSPLPNVILILTDDMSIYDWAYLPNLKSLLVDQGVNFTNAFVTTSLCCPSRTSILRGQYAHNHQVLINSKPLGGYEKFKARDLGNSTLASWLQDGGYRTALIGKFLNGYFAEKSGDVPIGWDEWYAMSCRYYDYFLNENGRPVFYGDRPEDYSTDVLAGKAYDFIKRTAVEEKPFFLYLATSAPHYGKVGYGDKPLFPLPVPALRHQNEFQDVIAPRPPSFNEQDVSDKPRSIRSLPLLSSELVSQIDKRFRLRLQTLLAVDELLAGIIDTLRATGQLDRTYIFFASDNGYHFGEHRIPEGKGTCYDEAVRVPLIVRGPVVPPGVTDDHLVLNIDLASTFAELAGTPIPEFVDGRSLSGFLRGYPIPEDKWRRAILSENWGGMIHRSAVRTKDYKYVRRYDTGEIEFYDLINDPYELQSLHNTASPLLLQGYSDWLDQLNFCSGQSCRDIENLTPPR